ncbi:MAG: hypothetical protein KBT88_06860 [Gammaproteobacteria bacterium]|nr:hypothetical protein [Gammaproteobacteria bacterium]MBQ0839491.1 hypothetical protein [Gammaproteobacteria bacterium]
MKLIKVVALNVILALLLSACSESQQEVGPTEVAANFWKAMEMGDRAEAEQLAVPGSLDGSAMNFETEGNRIESITFAEAMVSADMAAVPTTMEGEVNGRPIKFSFDTRLVPIAGVWKVDFNTTSTGMMGAMLKQAMNTFGEVMAEGMGQAVTDISAALSDSVDVLAESLREGFEQGASGLSQGLDSASDTLRTSAKQSAPVTLAARVSGEIQGFPTQLVASEWSNTLAIYQGDSWSSNPSMLLFLFLPEGELPVGRLIEVASDDASFGHPHVHYRWRDGEGEIQTTVLTGGYNLQLQFGEQVDGQVDAQISFDVPGEETRLQGEFSIRVD